MSDGHGLVPIVFLGRIMPGAKRDDCEIVFSNALIQMRDWCASDGRDPNRREITGATPAARLGALIGRSFR